MSLIRKLDGLMKTGWLKKKIENNQVSHMKETMNIKRNTEIPGKNNEKQKQIKKKQQAIN